MELDVTEVKAGLQALRAEREELDKRIAQSAAELFSQASKGLFFIHPKLKAFGWKQYTPYFNDGDECVFGAHTDEPDIQFGNEEELSDFYFSEFDYVPDGDKKNRWGQVEYKKVPKQISPEELEKVEAQKSVRDFLQNFSGDDLKGMFGDHRRVSVTPEGADSEEYNHD